ncbi:MAG: phosphatidate cytidylyltransferase [Bacteroidota bacterium]
MKNLSLVLVMLCCVVSLSSCEAIGAIFKAGVWSGILLVALVVGIIVFIISRLTGKK